MLRRLFWVAMVCLGLGLVEFGVDKTVHVVEHAVRVAGRVL